MNTAEDGDIVQDDASLQAFGLALTHGLERLVLDPRSRGVGDVKVSLG